MQRETHRQFASLIRSLLKKENASVRAAALRAGIPVRSFQGILDGQQPSIGRAAEICDAFGLEFYIGPPRGGAVASPGAAPETELQAGTDDLSPEIAAHIKATRDELTRLEATLRRKPAVNLDDAGALVGAVNDDDPPSGARYVGLIEAEAAAR